MIRKFLMFASLAGFLMTVSVHAQPMQQKSQQDQPAAQVQSVTGKVTQVETGGKAFSMDVNDNGDKHQMRFVVDKGTTVQGHVAAGSSASVDYQADANGQLVALMVKEQSQQTQ
jgi:predicted lipoprotein